MSQIKIFVINLKRSKARKAYMENLLGGMGLDHEFIEAVDGDALCEQDYAGRIDTKFAKKRKPVTMREVGCALSHLKAYESMAREGMDYACIMEDDILINHPQSLRWILTQENLLALREKTPFDIILLYTRIDVPGFWQLLARYFPRAADRKMDWFSKLGKIKITHSSYLAEPCYPFWGALAYIVNRRAYETFIEEQYNLIRVTDVLTTCSELLDLKLYFLKPLLVDPDEKISSEITDEARFYSPEEAKKEGLLMNIYKFLLYYPAHITLYLCVKLRIISLKRAWLTRIYTRTNKAGPAKR